MARPDSQTARGHAGGNKDQSSLADGKAPRGDAPLKMEKDREMSSTEPNPAEHPQSDPKGDWGLPAPKPARFGRETKLGLVMVLVLIGAFGFVVWTKLEHRRVNASENVAETTAKTEKSEPTSKSSPSASSNRFDPVAGGRNAGQGRTAGQKHTTTSVTEGANFEKPQRRTDAITFSNSTGKTDSGDNPFGEKPARAGGNFANRSNDPGAAGFQKVDPALSNNASSTAGQVSMRRPAGQLPSLDNDDPFGNSGNAGRATVGRPRETAANTFSTPRQPEAPGNPFAQAGTVSTAGTASAAGAARTNSHPLSDSPLSQPARSARRAADPANDDPFGPPVRTGEVAGVARNRPAARGAFGDEVQNPFGGPVKTAAVLPTAAQVSAPGDPTRRDASGASARFNPSAAGVPTLNDAPDPFEKVAMNQPPLNAGQITTVANPPSSPGAATLPVGGPGAAGVPTSSPAPAGNIVNFGPGAASSPISTEKSLVKGPEQPAGSPQIQSAPGGKSLFERPSRAIGKTSTGFPEDGRFPNVDPSGVQNPGITGSGATPRFIPAGRSSSPTPGADGSTPVRSLDGGAGPFGNPVGISPQPGPARPGAIPAQPGSVANGPFGAPMSPTPVTMPALPVAPSPPAVVAPSPVPVPAGTVDVHVVEGGENFWTISKKRYGAGRYFLALARFNKDRIPDPNKMKPGMKVLIPPVQALESGNPDLFKPGNVHAPGVTKDAPAGIYQGPSGEAMYRVGPEDSLSSISQSHLGRSSRWIQIYEMNRDKLATPNSLTIGMELKLPNDASRVRIVQKPM